MGLIALALQVFGTGADAIAVGQFISAYLKGQGAPVPDLFRQCFIRAVARSRGHLGHFVRDKDPTIVTVDRTALDHAIAQLDNQVDLSHPGVYEGVLIRDLVPALRGSLVMPGHQLTDAQFDAELGRVLEQAIADFFARLPVSNAALGQVELAHVARSDQEHDDQRQLLDKVQDALKRIEDKQSEVMRRLPYLDATVIQQESGKPEHHNPFRLVKAEDFNQDYDRIALLFREPRMYDGLRGPDNLIIAGGRGCGKSMILRSLAVMTAIELKRLKNEGRDANAGAPISYAESGLDYFGVYIKLARGYFHEWSADCKLTQDAATHLFQHVFNMLLLRGLIEALMEARDRGVLRLDTIVEHAAVHQICHLSGFSEPVHSFGELLGRLITEDGHVAKYLGNLRLGLSQPAYVGSHTSIHNFLDGCCRTVLKAVQDLSASRVFFLLDEYENLADFQQKVVNTLAKLRPTSLSLKVATRALGVKSVEDLQGEPIQRPRDYDMVELDYDVNDARYRELLVDIATKRLQSQDYRETDIRQLLPEPPRFHPATMDEVEKELEVHLNTVGRNRADLSEDEWREQLHQWNVALVFRIKRSFPRPRTYAGFDDFADLSSGIVSNFLELCKLAFYLAALDEIDLPQGRPIPFKVQSEAVYMTSRAYLDCVERNIEDTGPAISRLVLDLADVFREKLLHHHSEPEAARLVLRDPAVLEKPGHERLTEVLDDAVRWSVFHALGTASAYFPKHRSDVRSNDYVLNRLLCPILRLSPRPRWRTTIAASELAALLDHTTRMKSRNELRAKHGGVQRGRVDKADQAHPSLFDTSNPPEGKT